MMGKGDGQPWARRLAVNPEQVYSLRNCRFLLVTEGGYFFRLFPKVMAAITSISNAIVSVMLIGFTSF